MAQEFVNPTPEELRGFTEEMPEARNGTRERRIGSLRDGGGAAAIVRLMGFMLRARAWRGIGRMTCAFTREYGSVVACDLDAGFLERTHETVGRFGKVDRLRTIHVADGQTLDLPPNSADVTFSYITLQHCDIDDALDLTAEAVRVTRPGGRIALNYRARSGSDVVLLPPRIGTWLSQRRTLARLGWQANRLHPDQVIGPLAAQLSDIEVWRHPKSKISGYGAEIKTFDGINPHHYWVVATVR